MIKGSVSVGDRIVYTKRKVSSHPGPRAHDVDPAPRGEEYVYAVDKLWRVVEVREHGRFIAVTRRGKRHELELSDPHLRRPTILERLRFWKRWPSVPSATSPGSSAI